MNTRFTKDHEWVRLEDATATIGITDHAQQALGDVVYVELPAPGRTVTEGEPCAVVESVKAASDVFAPLAGTITARNDALVDDPAMVNREPHAGAWFFQMTLADRVSFDSLMDEDAYNALLETLA